MKAVILAAGQGKRLGHLGTVQPKGLVKIGPEPIIQRSITQLVSHGIKKVGIVVGFQAHKFSYLSRLFPEVSLIMNPLFAVSGSMESLALAHRWAKTDLLVLDSDIIYETRGLVSLLASQGGSSVLLSGPTSSGDEVWAFGTMGRVSGLSKNSAEFDDEIVGEFVGISLLQQSFLEAMMAQAISVRVPNPRDYEKHISGAASELTLLPRLVSDLIWSEIDTPEQLNVAATRILPKLDRVS